MFLGFGVCLCLDRDLRGGRVRCWKVGLRVLVFVGEEFLFLGR